MAADQIVGAIISAFVFLLLLGMVVSFLSNEFDFKKRQSHHIVGFLSFLFFTIFALHTTINSIISITSSSNNTFNNQWCLSKSLEMVSFPFGKLFTYQFFLFRLHQVFHNTPFTVRTWKLKTVALLVSIPIILQAVLGWFNAIHTSSSIRENADNVDVQQIDSFNQCAEYGRTLRAPFQNSLMIVGIALYLVTELMYSVFILRSFVGKILLLSMPSWNPQNNQNNSDPALFSGDLLYVAMRTTNLIILLVSSGLILLIKSGARLQIYWLNLEALITCLSVYLSFKCSEKYYNILFAPCHLWLHKPCIRCCFCCCLKRQLPKNVQLSHEHASVEHTSNGQIVAVVEGIGVVDVASSQSGQSNASQNTFDIR
eukprot:18606_1